MELQVKNEFIRSLNTASSSVKKISPSLNNLYKTNMENIAEIYRDKIFEYEEILKNNGMTFFTDNILGQIILYYFNNIMAEASKVINTISNNIPELPEDYILKKIVLKLNLKYVKEYTKLCNLLKGFSLEKDLKMCASQFFKKQAFCFYKPGWFNENYSNLKAILIKLEINIADLDETVFPIIEWQENQIEFVREVAKNASNSDSEEDIQQYIDNMIGIVREEMKGKRKKHT